MFTRTLKVLLFLSLCTTLHAQEKKQLTVEDIYHAKKFSGTTIEDVEWQPDSKGFTYTVRQDDPTAPQDIYHHDVASGETTVLIKSDGLTYEGEPVQLSDYSWTDDGKYLLIVGKQKQIWRHSREAPHYLYEVDTKELTPLAGGHPGLRNVKLSPNGEWVGFVREHNIYVTHLESGEEKAVTTDGTANVLNGEFDWVYEEEFGLADAWRWSPDGSKIAFWQIDQARVKEFHLIDQMPVYNEIFKLKYPKAGEKNAIVKVGVADLEGGEITWMDIGEETDIYIPRIFWTNSSDKLAIMRLNRLQNHLELLMADTETGESEVVITDTNPAWIDVRHDIHFLKQNDHIVWTSEKSGFRHAYLYDYDGNLVSQLTSGEWPISAVEGVDEDGGWLYFSGKKDSPIEENIYRVKLDGSGLERISQRAGWHSGDFSPNYQYVVGRFSDVKTPTQVMLRKTDGELVRWLEKNEIEALQDYNMVYPEFLNVTTEDGVELNAYMIKPADFDPHKKYPVLVFGYGGPGSQMVVNRWGGSRQMWHQLMTEKGYIVFCLDNRGTGGRGKAFKNLAYGDLSKWSVHDQIEGAKYLRSLPYVDGERIGFWGWSGGGYLTLMMLMRGADYFTTGVSVAPVSNFRFYDTIWTERYMGLPQENKEGYANANVLNYVDGLKGNLLIVHGTGDDNVHVQNTMHVVNELQKRAIQFDMMIYPNKNHRISGGKTQWHLFTKITDYLLENL